MPEPVLRGEWGAEMLITVYIPTRNRAALLEVAIASVRRQTCSRFELIVVDDASIDRTPSLLSSLAAREPRMRVITHAQPQGGAAARNAAIVAARGDFLTGLDDDDSFTPDRLSRFAEAWQRHERSGRRLSGLYSHVAVMEDGRVVAHTHKPEVARFEDMFDENVVGSQIFAPKRNFLDAGLFRVGLPAWQDLEFFMRVLKTAGPARLDDAVTYHWDNSVRADRVSLQGEEKLRVACDTVIRLHAGDDRRRIQQLYLQLFGRLYGLSATPRDWWRFLALGVWPRGILRLASIGVRRFVRVRMGWAIPRHVRRWRARRAAVALEQRVGLQKE